MSEEKTDKSIPLIEKAMMVETKAEAVEIKNKLIEELKRGNPKINDEKALIIVNESIGYHAGYYSDLVRARVEEFFECEHPYFGSIREFGRPTAAQALQMGIDIGKTGKYKRPINK